MERGGIIVAEALSLCTSYYGASSLRTETEITLPASMIYAAIAPVRGKRVLVIRGTSERGQWRRHNLALSPVVAHGDTRRWHRGFLGVAEVVFAWVRDKPKLDCITGHSLGAAVAQIIAPSLGVPAIAFASPQPLYRDPEPPAGHMVLNICRGDDMVCALPFSWLGYRKVGSLLVFDPARRHFGLDHPTRNYADAISGREPGTWRWVRPPSMGVGEVAAEKAGVS
jgi:hypothetical protein